MFLEVLPTFGLETFNWIKFVDHYGVVLVRALIIILVAFILTRILLFSIEKYRRLATPSTENGLLSARAKRLETLTGIMKNVTTVVILLVTLFILLSEVGINIAPLLAGAGIAGIAIGFGAQSLVKDLFNGFMILTEDQFSVGDVIKVGESQGQVERMTMRTVSLRDLDGRVHIIPNSEVNRVVVFSKDWSRMNLDLEVAYQTNMDEAFTVLQEVNKAFYKAHKDMLLEEPQIMGVETLGANGITIKVVAKTLPLKQWDISRLYRKRVKETFDQAGIEIPFPQRTIHLPNLAPGLPVQSISALAEGETEEDASEAESE